MDVSSDRPSRLDASVDESDNDSEPESARLPPSSSERRRARNARFCTWRLNTAEDEFKKQVKQIHAKPTADDELSIRDLLAKQESTPIIADPREYQIELFERAKQQNTVAVLDTGSGKTLIAVLLLRHIIDQELIDRAEKKAHRISFFLVPSVNLVFQQFAVLERNLDHSIERFCGAMKCNLWTREIWDEHFTENKVIVCTPDILQQCLMHSFITIRQINLLVFDEAHHAKKNSSYAQIMKDHYLREADHFLETADLNPELSSKVVVLYRYLSLYFERPSDHRCIVFVDQRVAARLLHRVFERIGGPHLRSGVLTGSGSGRLDDVQATFRSQVITLMKFRKGELNCLFATSVAEEGLDIPDCNLIIRFDICKTMIQYIQSRGRARHKNSTFLHMIEMNNSSQDRMLQDNRYSEIVMRMFCEKLPADRRLVGNEDLGSMLDLQDSFQSYTVPSTGAKITFGSCLQVLAHFASSLPCEGSDVLAPTYITSNRAGEYVCEVILPESSPIRAMIGDISSRKALAKRSAAFKACVKLFEEKYLDDHLLPIYAKKLPLMRNAALALNVRKTKSYTMRLKPSVWENSRGSAPAVLYFTLLDVPEGLDRPHRPLLLLSRAPLPRFPEFPLYLNGGRKVFVKSTSFSEPFSLSTDAINSLTAFTMRVYFDLFNKKYESDTAQMSYWLAPARDDERLHQASTKAWELVDWSILEAVHQNEHIGWTPETSPQLLLDKFLVDRWDGSRRWFSVRIAHEYKPLDAVPQDTIKVRWMANILDYSISLYKNARQSKTWEQNQPVIEAEQVLHRRNMLAEPDAKEQKRNSRCFLCPEPLKISALPVAVVCMCYVFPAIMTRVDAYLIAHETCEMLGLNVDIALALEAITKDSDNTEDHQNHERVNFQRGMGKNYERLEFLGDCFLKMATSISVFTQNPNDNEFDFHVKRMMLLCNKNLFNVGHKLGLSEVIRSRSFSRRTWYPEGLVLLEGKGKKQENQPEHNLGDKTVADVCEALMGAAFLSHNQPGEWRADDWRDAVVAVTKLVDSPDHTMMEWADYSKAYQKPTYQTTQANGVHQELHVQVKRKHGYHFQYPRLLQSAFLHPSCPSSWTGIPSYQRLEFLGDSLLDLACVTHLFYRYPDKDPQWLTEHKMAMVSNKFLGAVCVKIGFHTHLRHHSQDIQSHINDYVEEVQNAERVSQGAKDYWTSVKEAPKCLPDIVEAYVGAVFIDSDFDYNEVQRFFDQHIKVYFEDMAIYDSFANNHPVTRLHHVLAVNFGCQEYQLVASEEATGHGSAAEVVAGVMIHDCPKPLGVCRGKSGRYVKERSAKAALEELDGLAPFQYRSKYGCDCHNRGKVEREQWTAEVVER
ncbi:hypothetical protein MBLNU459_g7366t2 [Dothideomycetes sp. NU459]